MTMTMLLLLLLVLIKMTAVGYDNGTQNGPNLPTPHDKDHTKVRNIIINDKTKIL
jgi:hypothetical protein